MSTRPRPGERAKLTPHLIGYIRDVAEGKTYAKMARERFVEHGTVRTNLARARYVVGARSNAHMIHILYQKGVLKVAQRPTVDG